MSGRVIAVLLVVATICAEFPCSNGFQFLKNPDEKMTVVYDKGNKSMTMIWEIVINPSNEKFVRYSVKRYKYKDAIIDLNSVQEIASFSALADKPKIFFASYFKISGTKGKTTELTINDILKQGKNKDGSIVDVFKNDYSFKFTVDFTKDGVDQLPQSKSTKLIVDRKPSMKEKPESQYISTTGQSVTLKCVADGKPTPTYNWEHKMMGNDASSKDSTLVISNFKETDIGWYNCTATNVHGSASAGAFLSYTQCNIGNGCAIDDEIAIEMTNLKYSDYSNTDSEKYKELKKAIETGCMYTYASQTGDNTKTIYSCLLTSLRSGSVIANLKITYPTTPTTPTTSEIRKPLEDAIKTGTFAGYTVEKKFVSPTSAPTQPTTPTDKLTTSPAAGGPDSGQRADGEGGLGTGAIVAIVVVFAIIFIVIIVVLIVCMLKRRKPAPRKQYKEDGKSKPAAAPLKPQPFRDPTYDNGPDDRYPNEGGPPPQYTPANYAEVRPSHAEQNESGMEWDKSVRNDEMWI